MRQGGRVIDRDPAPGAGPLPAAKPVSVSQATLSRIMTAQDTNLYGMIHGGVIMKMCDDVAAIAASRHTGGPILTVAIDELTLLTPVHVGDVLQVKASVNWVGRSSLEVGVRVVTEPFGEAGTEPKHVAAAYLVFVAIDTQEHPRQIPGLVLENDGDRRRYAEAEIRRSSRLARRAAIRARRDTP